jgi:hypothetical protein
MFSNLLLARIQCPEQNPEKGPAKYAGGGTCRMSARGSDKKPAVIQNVNGYGMPSNAGAGTKTIVPILKPSTLPKNRKKSGDRTQRTQHPRLLILPGVAFNFTCRAMLFKSKSAHICWSS